MHKLYSKKLTYESTKIIEELESIKPKTKIWLIKYFLVLRKVRRTINFSENEKRKIKFLTVEISKYV